MPEPHREVQDLGLNALARVLAGQEMTYLPEHRRAGPCGTSLAGRQSVHSAIAWSLVHLHAHLVEYYAGRPATIYPRLGAKHGGGNGRAAYL